MLQRAAFVFLLNLDPIQNLGFWWQKLGNNYFKKFKLFDKNMQYFPLITPCRTSRLQEKRHFFIVLVFFYRPLLPSLTRIQIRFLIRFWISRLNWIPDTDPQNLCKVMYTYTIDREAFTEKEVQDQHIYQVQNEIWNNIHIIDYATLDMVGWWHNQT